MLPSFLLFSYIKNQANQPIVFILLTTTSNIWEQIRNMVFELLIWNNSLQGFKLRGKVVDKNKCQEKRGKQRSSVVFFGEAGGIIQHEAWSSEKLTANVLRC